MQYIVLNELAKQHVV